MADYLVWSGATGANNGGTHQSDWTNAFVSLNTAILSTPSGSRLIIAVDHYETSNQYGVSGINNQNLPYMLTVVNRATGVYTVASSPQLDAVTGGFALGINSCSAAGLSIRSPYGFIFGQLARNNKLRDINIACSGSSNLDIVLAGTLEIDGMTINTTVDRTTSIICTTIGMCKITDLVFSGRLKSYAPAITLSEYECVMHINGLDLSGIVSHSGRAFEFSITTDASILTIEGGKLPPGMVPFSAGPSSDNKRAILNNISIGGILADFVYDYRGTMTTDNVVYRVGGGANHLSGVPMSHVMRGNVLTLPHRPFNSRDYIVYVDTPGFHTIEFEALENHTTPLNSCDLYLRMEYPAQSSGQHRKISSRDLTPPTSMTPGAGLAGWQSPPPGTRSIKMVGEITLEQAGVVRITPVLSRFEAGKSVWLDPKMIVN